MLEFMQHGTYAQAGSECYPYCQTMTGIMEEIPFKWILHSKVEFNCVVLAHTQLKHQMTSD